MLRNYFLINMVLVVLLCFLGFKLYEVVSYKMEVPTEASVSEELASEGGAVKFKRTVPDKASFQIISGKDLFRPSRTAPAADVKTAPVSARGGSPKLFATILSGSRSIAIIEDPDTKKTKSYRVNDLVGGFVVSEILKDRVILSAGDEKIEVKLREDKGIKTSRPQPLVRQNNVQNRRARPIRRTPPRRIRREVPDSGNRETDIVD